MLITSHTLQGTFTPASFHLNRIALEVHFGRCEHVRIQDWPGHGGHIIRLANKLGELVLVRAPGQHPWSFSFC